MRGIPRALPPLAAALAVAIAAVGGCTGEEGVAGLGLKRPTAAPSSGNLAGGSSTPGSPSPTPSASAPTPTPSPTPTPQAVALAVSISPATVQLSVPAGAGAGLPANYPTTAQLSALVTFSDGSTSSVATWVSSDPSVVAVGPTTGLVTVQGPGVGTGPWTIPIQAYSADQKASGVRNVTVSAEGAVAIEAQ